MTSTPVMRREEYAREDFAERCLFTGLPCKKTRRGEHVIPRWLIDDYKLNSKRVEMGWPGSLAQLKEFRSRADPKSNGKFGELEHLVKEGRAGFDQLHLWQKKISVGMVLNHWRLAKNTQHPQSPQVFDTRYLKIALDDFQKDFEDFASESPIPRRGSTLVLPTKIPNGWLAHVFGSTIHDINEKHDAVLPFGLLALTHNGNLIVSTFFDPERRMEQSRLATEWLSSELHQNVSIGKIQAALAVTYTEFLASEISLAFEGGVHKFDELLTVVGYQLGVDIDPIKKTFKTRCSG